MLKKIFVFSVFMAVFVACSNKGSDRMSSEEQQEAAIRYEYGIAVDSFRVVTGEVQQGETLGGILNRLGAGKQMIAQLPQISKEVFDVRQIRAGKEYMAFYNDSNALKYFVYIPSRIESVVFHLQDSLHIEKQQKEVRIERHRAQAVIQSSLWNAMVDAGAPVSLAIELSEVYAWTIDFFGLQKGDRLTALYDEQFVDSTSLGVGRIYAAAFWHAGKMHYAYFFDEGDTHGYFDENGNSLRKAFLKAPLNYKRISSTFTYARKHPIFKTVRPHTGVDYAAPAGTPVVALGDGKVIEKGYKGGGGNTIKIRHNSVYTTAYLHLKGFAKGVEVGKSVAQGQVIGYVGSTGHSTGPHLDFRVWKDGTPVNPLTLESPSVDPVPQQLKQQFDSIVNIYNKSLEIN